MEIKDDDEWKVVPDMDGIEASRKGRIKINGVIIKPVIIYNKEDNRIDRLRAFGNVSVGDLVARAWIGPRPPGQTIDHINRNVQDNRVQNLRWATPSEQAANHNKKRGNYTSKYIGVCRDKSKSHLSRPWTAQVGDKILGYFATDEEAARVRDTEAIKCYDKPALNFGDKEEVVPPVDTPVNAATASLSGRNKMKPRWGNNMTSRYLGVCKLKDNRRGRKRWKATICRAGRTEYLGSYMTEEEAARARDVATKKYYPNPILNFPEEDDDEVMPNLKPCRAIVCIDDREDELPLRDDYAKPVESVTFL